MELNKAWCYVVAFSFTTQGADREVSTEVRGFTLIISKASNRSALTAASARIAYPFRESIIKTREREFVSIINFSIIV